VELVPAPVSTATVLALQGTPCSQHSFEHRRFIAAFTLAEELRHTPTSSWSIFEHLPLTNLLSNFYPTIVSPLPLHLKLTVAVMAQPLNGQVVLLGIAHVVVCLQQTTTIAPLVGGLPASITERRSVQLPRLESLADSVTGDVLLLVARLRILVSGIRPLRMKTAAVELAWSDRELHITLREAADH
jgi:hypothetical protein